MSTALSPNQKVQVTITSLAHGGSGVARFDDFVIFTPQTCPGDDVQVEITEIKKNYAEGRLIEVIKASPHRVLPPCPVFGQCGGCQWQHVTYEEQLHQKQLIVGHALSRIGREEGIPILPIIPSPDQFNYRNRAQFRAEGPKVGFYQRHTHSLIEFEKCLILDEKINVELQKLKDEKQKDSVFKTAKIEVYLGENNQVFKSLNKTHGEELGFSQVNTKQNKNIQDYLKEKLGSPKAIDTDNLGSRGNLLDLYCGKGNFSLPLNELGWRIYGVDSSRQAITQARKNANPQTFFSAADVSLEVKKLAEKKRKYEVILLDPPRIGADERLWQNLKKLDAETLVYISCNPATFARDWARMKAQSNYKLESIQPFDMFPQTFHVELVAIARKKK